jgi:Flp pilus assembly protein TadD
MVRYAPGYKGFTLSFEIVPPDLPKTATQHIEKGELLFHIYDFLAAQEELDIAIQEEPNNPKAHRLLGTVYSLLNSDEDAERELKKAIALDRNDESAHNNLGTLYDKLNRGEEAEKELKEAIRIKPADLLGHYNFAVFLGKRDRLDEARNEYLEMLKVDEKCVPAYGGLFSLLMKNKELGKEKLRQTYSEAERLFIEGISRIPNNANIHSYLGYVQCSLRKFKEAETEFNIALRMDRNNQLAQAFLALKQKGEWEKMGVPQ